MADVPLQEVISQSRPRCPRCKCWLTPICAGTDTVCGNPRCEESWQACSASFETSLLGAAFIGPNAVEPYRSRWLEANDA